MGEERGGEERPAACGSRACTPPAAPQKRLGEHGEERRGCLHPASCAAQRTAQSVKVFWKWLGERGTVRSRLNCGRGGEGRGGERSGGEWRGEEWRGKERRGEERRGEERHSPRRLLRARRIDRLCSARRTGSAARSEGLVGRGRGDDDDHEKVVRLSESLGLSLAARRTCSLRARSTASRVSSRGARRRRTARLCAAAVRSAAALRG